MALFGSIQTVRAQAPRGAAFAKAWAYIDELLRPGSEIRNRVAALASGTSQKHDLGDGVFTIEQAYETKPRAEAFFEAHRKFIDVQVVVSGNETMEVLDISQARVRDAYQESRDLITFEDFAGASLLRMRAGEAAVFFPADVHMPSVRTDAQPVVVRKAVLKLPVEA